MKRLTGGPVAIDQGEEVLFSDFEHGGEMWRGEGQRSIRQAVQFSESFAAPPAVTVTLRMLDISNSANLRVDLLAENVTEAGFDIRFGTWGDTRIARVRVGWQALGVLKDEEIWEVD